MEHILIINPAAGRKNCTGDLMAQAKALEQQAGVSFTCVLTKSAGHAAQISRAAAEKGRPVRLYACGGDGTMNEVANGIIGFENAAMTCVPIGTGNDFLKNFGLDQVPRFLDLSQLWDGPQFPLDAIDCNGRCCMSIACSGIDAQIAESVHRYGNSPLLSGRGSYLASVAVNFLFRGIGHRWTVQLDDETVEGEFALISMCNGRHYGGGSTPVPQARLDDGVLQTILVKKVGRLTFGRLFPAYSAGNYQRFPHIARVVSAKTVTIRSEEEIVTCLDGECFRSHAVTMSLHAQKVNFFAPPGCDPNATAREAPDPFMNNL